MAGRPVRFVAVVAVGLAVNAGCMSLPKKGPGMNAASSTQVPSTEATGQKPLATDEPVMTAVADFLSRTKDYQLSEGPSAGPPKSGGFNELPENSQIRKSPSEELFHPVPIHSVSVPAAMRDVFTNSQVDLVAEAPIAKPELAPPVIRLVSARPRQDTISTDIQPAAVGVNQPLDASRSSASPFDERLCLLEQRASQEPDVDTEWELRLMQLALHRDAEVRELSPSLPAETRELLSAFADVAIVSRSAARSRSWTDKAGLERVEHLRNILQERLSPSVENIALCRRVVTFGVYDETTDEELVSGKTLQTIIYSEIQNLRSEKTEDGRYRVSLRSRLELLTAEGRSIWQREEPEIIDLCRRRRSDFFLAQRVSFPADLAPGMYNLKVFVEDRASGQAGESLYRLTLKPRSTPPVRFGDGPPGGGASESGAP